MAKPTTRTAKLNQTIRNLFGKIDSKDVENLDGGFKQTTTRLIQIVESRSNGARVMDLFEDLEFSPVRFPENIKPHLHTRDVFLSTLGLRDGTWEVRFMSPRFV